MTASGVIGRGNQLPWHIAAELKYFRRMTLGKTLIMGRATFESIGRPLPRRQTIVLSRNADLSLPFANVQVAHSVAAALARCRRQQVPEVMICGGASIYAAFLPYADLFYRTLVADAAGDVYFPTYDATAWQPVWQQAHPQFTTTLLVATHTNAQTITPTSATLEFNSDKTAAAF